MEKTQFTSVQLSKGVVEIYDFGSLRLHAYKTNDLISDECFLVEKDKNCFMIESPCFFDNISELEKYISDSGMKYFGAVIAYHGAGASFMKGSKVYSTQNADDYNHNGGGAGLVSNFAGAFGKEFDSSLYATTDFIDSDTLSLCGVEMKITKTSEAFDIFIPEINAIYTHMLGHDVHSIVAGSSHADAIISVLESYIQKNIALILTSHYVVENLEDVKTKIEYLKNLKNIAIKNADAVSFKNAVQSAYPKYSGLNYLEMSAGMFFKDALIKLGEH